MTRVGWASQRVQSEKGQGLQGLRFIKRTNLQANDADDRRFLIVRTIRGKGNEQKPWTKMVQGLLKT